MKKISLSQILFYSLIFATSNFVYCQAPTLGAIRWDAYTGAGNAIGIQVESALSPARFHYRVPFFGVEVDKNHVTINGTSQDIMDKEIEYAKYAGLDYWAFVWYSSSSGLDKARKLYYSSLKKSEIDYCLILDQSFFISQISIADVVKELKAPTYFKVMNNRPLLYFMGYASLKVADIDSLRARSLAAGAGNPYIVELRVDGNMAVVDSFHMDAFGMYATSWITNGVPYKSLADADLGQWNYIKSIGKEVVPHVSTGWDTRPIYNHPLSWYTVTNPNDYVVESTPEDISKHITDAIEWSKENTSVAKSNTILIYAWNEHVEGGWICPTLSNYGFTDRIDSMHAHFFKETPANVKSFKEEDLIVYPNPTNSKLNLDIHGSVNWSLRNLFGEELLSGSGRVCNLSSLSNGIYFIRVNNRNVKVIKV